jgi:hypothetical protein
VSFLVFHHVFENRCIFLLRLRQQPTSTLWFEDTCGEDDNPSFLSSSDPEEAAVPPRKSIFDLQSAELTAWKTLATILPRATPLPALSSLLQHRVFTELKTSSYVRRERRDVMTARFKYLQVKKSFDSFYLSTEPYEFIS